MKKAFNQILLKHFNSRNLYFVIALIAVAAIFFGVSFTEDFTNADFVDLRWIFAMFFYVWLLAIYGGEIASGFLAKQISNGLSRSQAYVQMLLFSLLFSIIFYVTILVILLCFTLVHSGLTDLLYDFMGIPLLSFICLSQITLLIALVVKNAVNSIVIGYFLFLGMEPIPAYFLAEIYNPHFMLISPHHLAKQLIIGNNQVDILVQGGVMLLYTVIFSFLSYLKIKKMDLA